MRAGGQGPATAWHPPESGARIPVAGSVTEQASRLSVHSSAGPRACHSWALLADGGHLLLARPLSPEGGGEPGEGEGEGEQGRERGGRGRARRRRAAGAELEGSAAGGEDGQGGGQLGERVAEPGEGPCVPRHWGGTSAPFHADPRPTPSSVCPSPSLGPAWQPGHRRSPPAEPARCPGFVGAAKASPFPAPSPHPTAPTPGRAGGTGCHLGHSSPNKLLLRPRPP